MSTRVPEGSSVYVFGSALVSAEPADVDVLIVYDHKKCPPAMAFDMHQQVCADIEEAFGLPVHLTLLTCDEARSSRIFERVAPVPFSSALQSLCRVREGNAESG